MICKVVKYSMLVGACVVCNTLLLETMWMLFTFFLGKKLSQKTLSFFLSNIFDASHVGKTHFTHREGTSSWNFKMRGKIQKKRKTLRLGIQCIIFTIKYELLSRMRQNTRVSANRCGGGRSLRLIKRFCAHRSVKGSADQYSSISIMCL